MKQLLFALSLVLGLSACAQEPQLAPEAGPVATVSGTYFVPITLPAAHKAAFDALDFDQRKALSAEIYQPINELHGMVFSEVPVDEMHQRVQGMLRDYEQHPFFYQLEQAASNVMLRRVLSESDLSGRTNLISDYTARLLHNEHPDASVLAPALEALQGVWSEGRIQNSAEQAITFAQRRIERDAASLSKGCTGCDSSIVPGDHQVTMASHVEGMTRDIDRLVELVNL